MSHALKICVIVIGAALGLGNQALAQCFVCSDFNKNTGVGTFATSPNAGSNNTASGYQTLSTNNGNFNTADGYNALYANTSGGNNVAAGASALYSNTTAVNNTAVGFESLYANTTASNNTAVGFRSLFESTIGTNNLALGVQALYSSTTGSDNNAAGYAALLNNTTGARNSGLGTEALFSNTTGNSNNALGYLALRGNTTGSFNVAIGHEAGYYPTSGSYNIDIGNVGAAADNGIIRIGQPGAQTQTYVAGIATAQVTGSAVYVTAGGQLGVLASSERYKTAIAPMGPETEKLDLLRPVSFHLKTEPNGAVQYGLIAEEVDKVYPELVIRDAAGKIQGVRYDELAPMLLNEVQQLKREMAELKQANRSMQAAMAKLVEKDQVAMR
jgi:hypothetical protein